MPSFGSLNIAYTGLNAHQQRLNVIGENITNVNTPGYHRQRVELGSINSTGSGFVAGTYNAGGGVEVRDISRIRNETLSTHARAQGGRASSANETADVYHQMEQIMGGFNPGGLHDQMTDLFNSFDDLAGSPDDPAMRRVVLQRAEIVAQGFTRTAGAIDGLRDQVIDETFDSVRTINALTAQIAAADAEILGANNVDASPNALTDKRDQMITELAELADVLVVEHSDGQVAITLDGQLLVSNGQAQEITVGYDADATLTPLGYAQVNVLNSTGRVLSIGGGRLGAQLDAMQNTIPQGRRELDAAALDLATQVNDAHQLGEGLDGSSGNNLFEIGPESGQVRLSPDVADQPEKVASRAIGAGMLDNANARELSQLGDSATGPLAGFVELVGSLAARITAADGQANAATIASDQASAMAQAAGGVSLDEELTDLITAQRSYEASARVMTAIDEMLQVLLSTGRVGR